uniref:Myelin protein zero like 3 n=1 Tax=Equus asinus TaxID=9793 RepID=A0A8C4LER7_EQUAS
SGKPPRRFWEGKKQEGVRRWLSSHNHHPLGGVGVCIVVSLEIKADAHVRGYVGEKIKLKCTFRSTSSVTDKLTIDWTYRPPSSSRTESIFHYQSFQYPTTAGTFRDRISWVGDVYKGDASISISDPTIRDNGTFSCAVKNPPDVHHNIPLTELTVTERGFGTMLSSVALLSILVFIPSAAVVVLLLVRMGRKSAGLKKRGKSGYKKSSIEVSDDTQFGRLQGQHQVTHLKRSQLEKC